MIKSWRTKYRIKIRQYDQGRRNMFPPAVGCMRSVVNKYKQAPFYRPKKIRRIKAYIAARVLVTGRLKDVWRFFV